jgi:NADH-quinone oxidoreductase subunit G
VLAGPRALGSPGAVEAAQALAEGLGGRFALLCRRANDRGALRAGLHPGLLPGGVPVEDEARRARIEVAWGTLLPSRPGRDTSSILAAAADGELDVLFLVGVDPIRDFPDAELARRALRNVPYKVVVDVASDAMAIYADAMLPAAAFLEKDGHYTDWEGRAQRLRPVRSPAGLARSEWEIFQELSEAMGRDMGFSSLSALHSEMGSLLSSVAGGPRGAPSGYAPPEPSTAGASGEAAAAHGGELPSEEKSDLVLFTYSLLVDEGRLSRGADRLKEGLEQPAFVEVHPSDAERLGVEDGARVRLSTAAGAAELSVRVTEGILPGVVFVPFNNPGLAANTLLRGSLVAAVTLEPAGEKVGA